MAKLPDLPQVLLPEDIRQNPLSDQFALFANNEGGVDIYDVDGTYICDCDSREQAFDWIWINFLDSPEPPDPESEHSLVCRDCLADVSGTLENNCPECGGFIQIVPAA